MRKFIWKLNNTITEELLGLAESGMGYQIFEKKYPKGETYIVYNCELAFDLDNHFEGTRDYIIDIGYEKALKTASTKDKFYYEQLLDPYSQQIDDNNNKAIIEECKPNDNEIFVRMSAYLNDRRIDFDKKCLRAGAYTTTLEDYLKCKNERFDPRDRYALPNEEVINWAFFIKPDKDDKFKKGIVKRAFEHRGGGIEAFFEKETKDGTYLQFTPYY